MSLINQVLQDLEQRRGDEVDQAAITDELCFRADAVKRRRPLSRHSWLLIACLILLLCGGGYGTWHFLQALGPDQVAAQKVQQTPPPSSVAAAPPKMDLAVADTHRKAQTPKPETTTKEGETASDKATTTAPASFHAEPAKPKSSANHNKNGKSAAVDVAQKTPTAKTLPSRRDHTPIVEPAKGGSAPSMRKKSVPLKPQQQAELAYQKGYEAMQAGNTVHAERQLRNALAADPAHLQARELLAGLYIRSGRWLEAGALLEAGIKVAPSHLMFRKLYARALMQQGRDSEAVTVLHAALPPIAADPEYHALLAALYQRIGKHQAAAAVYLKVLKLFPRRGIWWVGLGISLEAMDKNTQAHQAYLKAKQSGTLPGDIARYTDNRLLALDVLGIPAE
jgi:MSHA biogenesis protein MshN